MSSALTSELGVLPQDWRVNRFDSLFSVQQGKQVSKKNREGNSQRPFLRTKNVFWGRLDMSELDAMHFTEPEEARLALQPGDLLICEGGDIGRTAIWRGELPRCYYQNHLHRARRRNDAEADPEFALFWLWYAFEIGNVYFGRGNVTTIPNLSQSKLCELPLPLPSLPEQRKIADILGLVQRAIEQQERLMALTTELKKALLHKLFTEGLRGEPQKQTEIGPVPESWKIVRLEDAFETQLGKMLSQKAHGGNDPKYYLRNKNVQWGTIDLSDMLQMDFSEREKERFLLVRGDLLVCEGGQPGRAAIWNGDMQECYYQKALHRVRPKDERISNEFLAYWMAFSFQLQNLYGVAGASSTIAHLPEVQLKALPIPRPERSEQDEMCNALSQLDGKISVLERKRAIVTELFRTLLHQLMTAQIRVHDLELRTDQI
jgi:type I restriction enzyme S subunit